MTETSTVTIVFDVATSLGCWDVASFHAVLLMLFCVFVYYRSFSK